MLRLGAVTLGLSLFAQFAAGDTAPMVSQRNKLFKPASLEIARGSIVAFTNDDPFLHHIYVESPRFAFDSDEQPPGKTVQVRFDRAGSFVVQCAIHLKMKLPVAVR